MGADIEPGPIEHRPNVGSLNGHVGGSRGAVDDEQAQAHTREYAHPGSAAADHGADISSAGIPAVSFVVPAIMPARYHPSNEAVGPALWISRFPRSTSESKMKARFIPCIFAERHCLSPIATHLQLQE